MDNENRTIDPILPSGSEVESTRFVFAPAGVTAPSPLDAAESGMGNIRGRVEAWRRAAGAETARLGASLSARLTDARRSSVSVMNSSRSALRRNATITRQRIASAASTIRDRIQSMRTSALFGMREGADAASSNMHENALKWAGAAAAAGFAMGATGRFLRHRAKRHRVPHVVVIEAAC